jgi:phosphonate degradation associated HDIG domain protein
MSIVEQIESLFLCQGWSAYEGALLEPVSALEHALQAAQLAEWDDADESLVAAALLHDIGQLLPTPPGADLIDDVHELRAVAFLSEAFGPAVLEPVRLHVQAKRYLVALEPGYASCLSPASRATLVMQGGAMTAFEIQLFEALPLSADAVRLRRWDDKAKQPGKRTAPLPWYLSVLESLQQQRDQPARIEIASFSVA